ncbi:alpha/beta hydrolase [Paenibacillus sp. J5C_2022]|uniref:alpha/beta hydrolase family protein n=1 Tax=Paenibacillus sp. J5C2022 TaxID=2977129 RepID=UPI0021D028AA|nr:CocE/NonD family hydrolase [Paenibacillus sp. J5C2022]MCU6707893.1 alpha/beta hydrolase [Paenibacillus sp. J5C2022]
MTKKRIGIALGAIILLLAAAGIYIAIQHDYDMKEQVIEIDTPEGKLTGTFVLPKSYDGKLGLVLFIHGDGPIDATHSGGYRPLWERLASLGYASLSIDKRGINGSEGNWEHQSMEDRMTEARRAMAWAKKQPMIDGHRIGAWGASQAGWVIPKLAGEEQLTFSILVSPAVNWVEQGRYHTRAHRKKAGLSDEEIDKALAYDKQVLELLERQSSYEDYLKIADEQRAMSKDRWLFAGKNYMADSTEELSHFKSPVLLLLGEKDIHVDIKDTEQVYREKIDPQLLDVTVFQNTEHSMLSVKTANSELRALWISVLAPRQITVPAYMDRIEQFLRQLP